MGKKKTQKKKEARLAREAAATSEQRVVNGRDLSGRAS
jgi:hypothetical protein